MNYSQEYQCQWDQYQSPLTDAPPRTAELHSEAGTQRFLYENYADPVTLVQLNESGEFMGSGDLTKAAARAMWNGLVNSGWTTKRITT